MANIILNKDALHFNYKYLNKLFDGEGIEWGIVSKLLCGNSVFFDELLALGHKQICDSRISHLRLIKSKSPDTETIYIKPPARRSIKSIVSYADVSLNTTISTVKLLSQEAERQKKIHKIIIMVELGELREGVLAENILDFFKSVYHLPNIKVVGLGTNLTCLNGVLPSYDKMALLTLTKKLIHAEFKEEIPYISGGTSVTIPLLFKKLIPEGINHFRVGETLFFGTNVYNNTKLDDMKNDVFLLEGQIVELKEKPIVPIGNLGSNLLGETTKHDPDSYGKKSTRALLDIGLLDVDYRDVVPMDKDLNIIGSSSDMMVIDLGDNRNSYKVGDTIHFKPNYMGVLRLMASNYVKKLVK